MAADDEVVGGQSPPCRAAPCSLGKCKNAEAEKARNYRDLADQMGATFVAFAVETMEMVGDEGLAFIRQILQEQPKAVVHGVDWSVAIVVVLDNASVVQLAAEPPCRVVMAWLA